MSNHLLCSGIWGCQTTPSVLRDTGLCQTIFCAQGHRVVSEDNIFSAQGFGVVRHHRLCSGHRVVSDHFLCSGTQGCVRPSVLRDTGWCQTVSCVLRGTGWYQTMSYAPRDTGLCRTTLVLRDTGLCQTIFCAQGCRDMCQTIFCAYGHRVVSEDNIFCVQGHRVV